MTRFVDDRLTVVVLTNSDHASPELLAVNIAALYLPGLIPERAVVNVGAEVLKSYAGRYQINPTSVLMITCEDGKLLLRQETSLDRLELLAESETSFFSKTDRRLTYRFVKDEKGQVTHLALEFDGREVRRSARIK
jgi:hypothetical protein